MQEAQDSFEYDQSQLNEGDATKNNDNAQSLSQQGNSNIFPLENSLKSSNDYQHLQNQSSLQKIFNVGNQPWKKTKIVSKLQELLQRKFQSSQNNYISFRPEAPPLQNKFIKPKIDKSKLLQLKAAFDSFHKATANSEGSQPNINSIGKDFNLPASEVQGLYLQYILDPEFTQRIRNIQVQQNPKGCNPQTLMEMRVQFLQELVRRRGPLTEGQIMAEMCKVDFLHQYSRGKMIPLSRKAIQQVMKLSHVLPRMIPSLQKVPSSQETIISRFIYAKRYMEITCDMNAEICFLGEYSFTNNFSLSGCPYNKRDTFVNFQCGKLCRKPVKIIPKEDDVPDKWGRNLQILVAMSLYGIIHYKLYADIFNQCNFLKTVLTIAKKMELRKSFHNKYLILETNFFHKKACLRAMEKLTSVKTIFLPPETPMLNPTQYLFNQLRQIVKSKIYKEHRALGPTTIEVLESMRESFMQCHFMSIRPYLQLALRRQSFK